MPSHPNLTPVSTGHYSPTPLGVVYTAFSDHGLVALEYACSQAEFEQMLGRLGCTVVEDGSNAAGEAARQVGEYLFGHRQAFDFLIDWERLPPFQQAVLRTTYAIPYGSTATYAEVARRAGRPGAARAAGRAEATNPMPLVIPCHRVVGTDGRLHGYGGAGGLQTKEWLLRLEARDQGVVELT